MSWQRVRAEFESLLDEASEQRERRLRELETNERWLAERVRELFQQDAGAGAFLERAPAVLAAAAAGPAVSPGVRVGRYRLVAPLGSGGMGAVWTAEQSEPHRRVAVKLLAQPARSAAERWRFEHEVQVLAGLNHPAIATFFEAGTDTVGGSEVAWLAMELVEGAVDVLVWARDRALPRASRLDLFLRLCEAVAHGHHHGVLHRDLKPGNVLVGRDGQLKLIDFGIARALGDAVDGVGRTRTGEVVGTLQSMAPEQLRGEVAAIGTSCDVYALGVLLYQLLCERAPFDFGTASFAEIARLVLEQEPTPPRRVRPDLPTDLAAIMTKALEKDLVRRYATVDALVADLERFRAHLPVLARPASLGYRLRKFVRRHRVVAGVVAAIAVGLAVGFVGLWRGAVDAREGERLAVMGREEAKKGERAALRASEFSREVLRVTLGLFDGIDETDGSRDVKVHELLDAAVLDTHADPGIEQTVRQVRGHAYARIGRFQEARREFERALALNDDAVRMVAGTNDEASARANAQVCAANLGRVLAHTGELERGDAMLRDAVDASASGDNDGVQLRVLEQFCHHLAEQHADAELLQVGEQLRVLANRAGGAKERIDADHWIAMAAGAMERHDEAKAAAERAWQVARENFGDDNRHTCAAFAAYVTVVQEAGDLDDAERLYPELIARVGKVYGASNPNLLTTLNNRAHLLMTRGKLREATAAMRDVVAAHEARGGTMTTEHLQAKHNLGMVLNQSGRFAEAEPLLRAAATASRQLLGPANPEGMKMRFNHGACLAWSHRFAEAEPILLAEYDALAATLPADHGDLAKARRTIADAYAHNGHPDDAGVWRAK